VQELENALGEVEFKDGIPDVKFSKVTYVVSYCHLLLLVFKKLILDLPC